MATNATLSNAVVHIIADTAQFTAALAGVKGRLMGFVNSAQALGGRVGAGVIGSVGQRLLAGKEQSMLSGPRKEVAYWKQELENAHSAFRNAMTKSARDYARDQITIAKDMLMLANRNLATAQQSFAGVSAGIAAMAATAAAAVTIVLGLAAALTILAAAGGNLSNAERNVGQVFGRSAAAVMAAAEEQSRAFGRSKSEYLAYAAEVGRGLEKLGVGEAKAAEQTTELLAAVSRLANSQGISFGAAFQQTQNGSMVTDDQVRAWAVQHNIIQSRNDLLNAGAEAMIRNALAIEYINDTTAAGAGSADTWNAQIGALQGNLQTLAETIGTSLEPTMVEFLQGINGLLQSFIAGWKMVADWVGKILDAIRGYKLSDIPNTDPTKEEVSAQKKAAIDQAGRRQAIGEGMKGGVGPYQGGLEGLHRHVQQASWAAVQAQRQEQQLRATEKSVEELRRIRQQLGGQAPPETF